MIQNYLIKQKSSRFRPKCALGLRQKSYEVLSNSCRTSRMKKELHFLSGLAKIKEIKAKKK